MVENLSIVGAWNKLDKINNKIELLKTMIESKNNISSSKLKEVLTNCSITNNDQFINQLISKDKDYQELSRLEKERNALEQYIKNEIKMSKITEPAICIAFYKEYYLKENNQKMTWEEIGIEMGYSTRQCKRYYAEYKGYTPQNNSYNKLEKK